MASERACKFRINNGDKDPFLCKRSLFKNDQCVLHYSGDEKDTQLLDEQIKYELDDSDTDILDLRGAQFHNVPEVFITGTIKKEVWFDEAVFHRNFLFKNLDFHCKCSFTKCEFKYGVEFINCKFLDHFIFENVFLPHSIPEPQKLYFELCEFHNEASFHLSQCGIFVHFKHIVFYGEANFKEVTFGQSLKLTDVVFSEDVSFEQTDFNKPLYFEVVNFRGQADFNISSLNGVQEFKKVNFNGQSYFNPFVSSGHDFSFYNCDLSGLRVLTLPLLEKRSVEFRSCSWAKKKLLFPPGRDVLADEYDLKSPFSYLQLLKAYKLLHKRYYLSSEFQQAREFYVGFMILKRKLQRGEWLAKRFDEFYSLFSRYGESIYRPFWSLIAMWLLVPIILLHLGIKLENGADEIVMPIVIGFEDTAFIPFTVVYWKTVLLNLSLSTLIRTSELRPAITSLQSFIIFLETVLNALFLGFFALGIRRRSVPKKPIE